MVVMTSGHHHRFCWQHCKVRGAVGLRDREGYRWPSSSFRSLASNSMMFLPNDLTATETDLVATLTRQLLSKRSPQTPAAEQAVRLEARQVAAEMIWAARAQTQTQTQDDWEEEEELDQNLAESPYHQRLAQLRETNLALQEAEDLERETDEAL